MSTSSQQKTAAISGDFRKIHNICDRADVGIGPYDNLFRILKSRLGAAFYFQFVCICSAACGIMKKTTQEE